MSTNVSSTITCSIRVNANTKRIFDKVCERIGITPSAAYSIFTNTVAAEQCIPFELTATHCNIPNSELTSSFDKIRAELDEQGLLRDYTMDDINALTAEARTHQYTSEELAKQEKLINEIFNNQ